MERALEMLIVPAGRGPICHLWSELGYTSHQAEVKPTRSKDMVWTEGLGS